jgi:hypothetical protein
MKLFEVYAFGLVAGAIMFFVFRKFCLQILHRNTPEAADMIGQLATTMVLAGLLQGLANWARWRARWLKVSVLYGALGVAYWLVLLLVGKTPAALLQIMPSAADAAFVILLVVWLAAMRPHKPAAQN